MNNNIVKLMAAGVVCMAMCGGALAAPRAGRGNDGPKVQQRAKAHKTSERHHEKGAPRRTEVVHAKKGHHAKAPVVVHHREPARHVVVRHAPPPVVVHHAPPPRPVVVHHECDDGLGLGALIGAVVGGIIGAAL